MLTQSQLFSNYYMFSAIFNFSRSQYVDNSLLSIPKLSSVHPKMYRLGRDLNSVVC